MTAGPALAYQARAWTVSVPCQARAWHRGPCWHMADPGYGRCPALDRVRGTGKGRTWFEGYTRGAPCPQGDSSGREAAHSKPCRSSLPTSASIAATQASSTPPGSTPCANSSASLNLSVPCQARAWHCGAFVSVPCQARAWHRGAARLDLRHRNLSVPCQARAWHRGAGTVGHVVTVTRSLPQSVPCQARAWHGGDGTVGMPPWGRNRRPAAETGGGTGRRREVETGFRFLPVGASAPRFPARAAA